MKKFFARLLPNWLVTRLYASSGLAFTDEILYIAGGHPTSDNIEKTLDRWGFWEGEYSRRGFRTVSLDEFASMARGHIPKRDWHLAVERLSKEEPVLHAAPVRARLIQENWFRD